jgi:hypothetical protein
MDTTRPAEIARALRTLGATDWRTAGVLLDAAPMVLSRQERDAVMAALGALIRGEWQTLTAPRLPNPTTDQETRDAFDRHLDQHHCGTGDYKSPHYIGGFRHCPEAMSLWELLSEDDQIILAQTRTA